jgi:hypothetical protein
MVAVCSGKVRHRIRQDVGIDARKPVKCRHVVVIAYPLRLNGVQGVARIPWAYQIGATRRLIVSAGWPLLIVGEKNAQSQNTQDI